MHKIAYVVSVAIAGMLGVQAEAADPVFASIYAFKGGADGAMPMPGLAIGSHGALYGTTYGLQNSGPSAAAASTVFQLKPSGGAYTETVLHTLDNTPNSSVVRDADNALFGTTLSGGTHERGTVFRLQPPASAGGTWKYADIYSFGFTDGAEPEALTIDQSRQLFGVTASGGPASATNCGGDLAGPCGVAFRLDPPKVGATDWTETIIHDFGSGTGIPNGPLLRTTSRRLYGTTQSGAVFEAQSKSDDWKTVKYTVLHQFGAQRAPQGSLLEAPRGILIGVATGNDADGTPPEGFVFALIPPAKADGPYSLTVLHKFAGTEASVQPQPGLVRDHAGNLYGATANADGVPVDGHAGSLYRLNPPKAAGGAWTETVLHRFTNGADGGEPTGGLVQGANGKIYGTTTSGGTGFGTVFMLTP